MSDERTEHLNQSIAETSYPSEAFKIDPGEVKGRAFSKMESEGFLDELLDLPEDKQKLVARAVGNAERVQIFAERIMESDEGLEMQLPADYRDALKSSLGYLNEFQTSLPHFRRKIIDVARGDGESKEIRQNERIAADALGRPLYNLRMRDIRLFSIANTPEPSAEGSLVSNLRKRHQTILVMEDLANMTYKDLQELGDSAVNNKKVATQQ